MNQELYKNNENLGRNNDYENNAKYVDKGDDLINPGANPNNHIYEGVDNKEDGENGDEEEEEEEHVEEID